MPTLRLINKPFYDQNLMNAHYQIIQKAIAFINSQYKTQPNLEAMAAHVGLSPFHFQRLFTEWAGTSPKKFLQYLSLSHAKQALANQTSILDASFDLGLSSPSRLHDLFIHIEHMTPDEYKNQGKNLTIEHSIGATLFGDILIASTAKGICYLAFADQNNLAWDDLVLRYPKANFVNHIAPIHQQALARFNQTLNINNTQPLNFHIKGTSFQLKVWEALLTIPQGQLTTYSHIAQLTGKPTAQRAVGTAIGQNPISLLIPCHRVIQTSGALGGYHWGLPRKAAIIGWEMQQASEANNAQTLKV